MKTCSKCKSEKPVTDFGPEKKRKDGLNPWCRACCNEYNRAYQAKREAEGVCTNDVDFGKWIRGFRLKLGMPIDQVERKAKLPAYRLAEIESAQGYGITRRDLVALSVFYKLDRGLIERKAVGA